MSTLSAPPREEAGASGLPRLPEALARWIGDAALTESSGRSGMRTLRVGGARGAYLKIGPPGTLARAARMQRWWADRGLSAPVAQYLSEDADYLLIEAVPGRNGIAPEHLAQPVRLARALGEALRRLREIDATLQENQLEADVLTAVALVNHFPPEEHAKKMELLRKLQMQDLAQQRGLSKVRL